MEMTCDFFSRWCTVRKSSQLGAQLPHGDVLPALVVECFSGELPKFGTFLILFRPAPILHTTLLQCLRLEERANVKTEGAKDVA
jgi:hypothetical protein